MVKKRLALLRQALEANPGNDAVSRALPGAMAKVIPGFAPYAHWFEHLRLRPLELGQSILHIIGFQRRWELLPTTGDDLPSVARTLRQGEHGDGGQQLLGILLELRIGSATPTSLRTDLDAILAANPGYVGLLPVRARLLALENRPLVQIERDLDVVSALRALQPNDGDYLRRSEQFDEVCQAWALSTLRPRRSLTLLEQVGRLGGRGGGAPHERHLSTLRYWLGSDEFKDVQKLAPAAFKRTTERICDNRGSSPPR
jgi:hypothetical protein